uniref:nitroreductase family protein n=1 Tax=Dialister sp. TaxID=1955814 RepID=UPI0040281799
MHDIIAGRRSVRFFKKDPIAESDMKEILRAGQWAPSPKNRQPWKFIVVKGMSRDMMIRLMEKGIERSEAGEGVLPGDSGFIANARFTMECMKKAPVTVLVVNPTGRSVYEDWSAAEKIHEMSDVQAIGAAAENMALEAAARGIGSLWVGNVFFAYDELT